MSWGVSISGESQKLCRQQATADVTCHTSCQPSPLTLLRSSPPLGRSGVLCSEDGFVFSLLLLESLSLMMSYCLQKRAITAAKTQRMKDSLTLPLLPTASQLESSQAQDTLGCWSPTPSVSAWNTPRHLCMCGQVTALGQTRHRCS